MKGRGFSRADWSRGDSRPRLSGWAKLSWLRFAAGHCAAGLWRV